jgi:hypothetical protein
MTIDADMKIVCPDVNKFRDAIDDSEKAVDGFSILQINNGTEYRNIRIMRRDRPWTCKGATHEYWACKGGVIHDLPKEIIYIQDIGDGGSKTDKFERDERLLREELKQEPDNERDVFYLANTLLCQEKIEEAAELVQEARRYWGVAARSLLLHVPARQDLRAPPKAHRGRVLGAKGQRDRPREKRGAAGVGPVSEGARRILQGLALPP